MLSTLFYSWQTDTNTKVTKYFIRSALEKAILQLQQEFFIEEPERVELIIDHDTKGLPGSPPIADAILRKISNCGIFLADLTYVARVPRKHGVSNPNVLTERGYAIDKVGHERMIAVMNEAYGAANKLPFDLQGLRWPIRYSLKPSDSIEKRNEQQAQLVLQFKVAILTILESGVLSKKSCDPLEIIKENICLPHQIIKIHEVLNLEVDNVCKKIHGDKFSLSDTSLTDESTWNRVADYQSILGKLADMFVVGGYWGDVTTSSVWADSIQRVGCLVYTGTHSMYKHWDRLALFAPLYLLYACGIAALKGKKYFILRELFNVHVKMGTEYHEQPVISISSAYLPLSKKTGNFMITNYGSQCLQESLQVHLKQFIYNEYEYKYYFHMFELIFNLLFMHNRLKTEADMPHLFCSLSFASLRSHNAVEEFKCDVLNLKNMHPLIQSGLFDGDFNNIIASLDSIQKNKAYA